MNGLGVMVVAFRSCHHFNKAEGEVRCRGLSSYCQNHHHHHHTIAPTLPTHTLLPSPPTPLTSPSLPTHARSHEEGEVGEGQPGADDHHGRPGGVDA